jgi:endonuclease III
MRIIPRKDWLNASHMMIHHGRAICIARNPRCAQCALVHLCPSAFHAS